MAETIGVRASGVVVGKWQYQGDTFLRILSRRQRNVPYPDDKKFDAFTVRLNYFLLQDDDAVIPNRHDIVHIEGFLQQRDNWVSLASLLRHKLQEEDSDPQALNRMHELDGQAHRIHFREDVVEIVALEWEVKQKHQKRDRRKAKHSAAAKSDHRAGGDENTPADEESAETEAEEQQSA
jgi:hypothetical protein